jgi:hypothetical protein
MKTSDKKICFVLMPFSVKEVDMPRYNNPDHCTEVYEGLSPPPLPWLGFHVTEMIKTSGPGSS